MTKPLRILPFIALSLLSFCVAAGIGGERKPFAFNFSLTTGDVFKSMGKAAHFESTALIMIFAILAVGHRRLRAAFVLTMLVCIGWELFETTAAGHTARLADLLPDLVSALVTTLVIASTRYFVAQFTRFRRRPGFE